MRLHPSSLDGSLFLGTTLEHVCFNQFSVALGFRDEREPPKSAVCPACGISLGFSNDKGKWIQGECEWTLRCGNEEMEHITEFPIQSSKLPYAIGKKVLKVGFDRKKSSISLQLEFEMSIEVIVDLDEYETHMTDDEDPYIIV